MTQLSFIVDENLPPHLAYWLRDKGHIATHVNYEGLDNGPDENIWAWAAIRNAIVVSRDEDFHKRVIEGNPPRLIWIRWHNARKKPLIEKMELNWPEIVRKFEQGEWFVELVGA